MSLVFCVSQTKSVFQNVMTLYMGKKTQRTKKEKDINFEVIVFAFSVAALKIETAVQVSTNTKAPLTETGFEFFFYMGQCTISTPTLHNAVKKKKKGLWQTFFSRDFFFSRSQKARMLVKIYVSQEESEEYILMLQVTCHLTNKR